MFLLWLLMRRLALGLPAALQLDGTPPILFHERGVSQFTRNLDIYTVTKALKLSPPGQIWALVDSNQFAKEPAAVFRNTIFFVVEAVSFSYPRLERTPLHTSLFFMKTWSFSEALQAYVEPPPSVCITTFTSSAADHSSDPAPPTGSVNSGIYTTSTGRPSWRWPIILISHPITRIGFSNMLKFYGGSYHSIPSVP